MNVTNVTADADVFTANAYLVPGETTALVDVGAMDGVIERIGSQVDSLDIVVLTHQHNDHVAQLPAVRDHFDPEILAYEDHPDRDHALADGDSIQLGEETYQVLHTPGHAPDHISLVGDRAVFSGDVFVYNDGAFDDGSFGRTDYPGQSRERLIESLETLRSAMPESVEYLYAGHGDIFEGDVHAALDRAIERAKRREPKYPEE